jgi:hypothetical protein
MRRERQLVSHYQDSVDNLCGAFWGIMAPVDGLAAVLHACDRQEHKAGRGGSPHRCICGEWKGRAVVICLHQVEGGGTCDRELDGIMRTQYQGVVMISSDPCGHLVRRQKEA